MLRIFLLIILLLTGCSSRDRSTADHINREQTEQTSSQTNDEAEIKSESMDEENVTRQLPKTQDGFFSTILYLILWGIVLAFIIGLTIIIYLKRRDYRRRISNLRSDVRTYTNHYNEVNRAYRELKSRNQYLKENLKSEKKQRRELEVAVSELQAKLNQKDIDSTKHNISKVETNERIRQSEVTDVKIDTKEEELFFELPNEYGKFKHGSGVSSLEERRLYKLTYRKGESEGMIEFISGKYDGIAINHKDSMIKPACSIIKENENNPTSVKQINPGIVKLDGEEWIIENKIKVEIR